ncbi:MAG: hypothetical protein KKH92_00375 [Firmicutes bacterium]|nr:hypothetical protein [Bacillota bacterium]
MNQLLKQEAVRRMKKLNLMDEVIEDFKERDLLYKSESFGILSWLNEEEIERVKKFEEQYASGDALVFHIITQFSDEGLLYTYLYVSRDDSTPYYKDMFDENLKTNVVFTYLDAGDTDYTSEHGTEYIEPSIGGLRIPYVACIEDYKRLTKFNETEKE